jgi:hypothetical protein
MEQKTSLNQVLQDLQASGPPPTDKKKRKRVNSGAKGDGWENMVARLFSRRFNRDFSKMPDSGARGTTAKLDLRAKEVLTSDIICPEGFTWTVECKKGYDIDLWSVFGCHLFKGRKKDVDLIEYFTTQALTEALSVGKKPCVIYRKDNRPAVAMIKIDVGGDEVFKAIKPDIYAVWNGWYVISLYDLLQAPNELFFTPELCPQEIPANWDQPEGKAQKTCGSETIQARKTWKKALLELNVDGLGLRELMKMPQGHTMRQSIMPYPFEPITIDDFIVKYHQPDEALTKIKRLIK